MLWKTKICVPALLFFFFWRKVYQLIWLFIPLQGFYCIMDKDFLHTRLQQLLHTGTDVKQKKETHMQGQVQRTWPILRENFCQLLTLMISLKYTVTNHSLSLSLSLIKTSSTLLFLILNFRSHQKLHPKNPCHMLRLPIPLTMSPLFPPLSQHEDLL